VTDEYYVDPTTGKTKQRKPMRRPFVVTLTSEADAEAVREALLKLLEQYEVVTRADYFELVGLSSTFEDAKVGWTELTDIQIKTIGENEFLLDLPEPKNI
jgi:hypothetical protein